MNTRWFLPGCLLVGCAGLVLPAAAGEVEPESILKTLSWMEQQASYVHSARGDFTVHYLPTTPEEAQRITALCRARNGEHHASRYVNSRRQALRRSYHSAWWRLGVMEREEKTHITRPAIVETTVFDGKVVQTLDGTPGRTCLYISSPENQWVHKSRIQPFTFAFEYRSSPHGDILRGSPERRIVRRRGPVDDRWEVTASHPTDDRLILRMVFDEQHRLLVRDAILTKPSSFMELDDQQPALYSRWEFSNFRNYDDGQGHQFWFPASAMLRYYLGTLPDRTAVQSYAMQIDIGDIEFNVDVPAERFRLRPPEGVPVHDARDSRFSISTVSY